MTPSHDQAIAMLPHVRYEIESLLLTPAYDPSNEALEESVLFRRMAHARVLHTFFTAPTSKRFKDDVLSADYGFRTDPIYGHDEKELLNRFNKDLFHLSLERLSRTVETKPWPMRRLLLPVIECSRQLIQHILGGAVAGVSEAELDKWRQLVEGDRMGAPLEQQTSNIAAVEVASFHIECRRAQDGMHREG
jgi:hypothetical protein